MSLSNILLIPGAGAMSFRDALSIFSPYSPRLAANYMDPFGSLYTDASRTTQVTAVGERIRSFTNFVTGGPHGVASSDDTSPLWNSFTVNGRTVRGAVFDGSDDFLQVSGFDMSNTAEVCVIAGVRKFSDAAIGEVVGLDTIASDGTFALLAPNSVSTNLGWSSKGTSTASAVATGITAPATRHVACVGDISGDVATIIVNTTTTTSSANQGTGNYRNGTLYIGRRGGATLPFNGAISYLFILGLIPPDDVLNRVFRGLGPQIGAAV